VSYFLFNFTGQDGHHAGELLREKRWPVGADERHRDELEIGDLALVYVAADRVFIALVELASGVEDDASEVTLASVEWWDPPAPIDVVIAATDPTDKAKAEFDTGVLRITPTEYEAAVAVGRRAGTA
jgi:hypothetical protein